MDLAEAIKASSEISKRIYSLSPKPYGAGFSSNFLSLLGMGFGFNRKSKNYQLVFHLIAEDKTDIQSIYALNKQMGIQEPPCIRITGQAVPYCLPHNNVYTRPLEMGSCISRLNNYGYGTLGSFVRKKDSDDLFILSCTHVLSPYDGFDPHTIVIVQPGMSSLQEHQVALLDTETFRPLVSTTRNNAHESMDASIAKVTCQITLDHINDQITHRGYYQEADLPELFQEAIVLKTGSTSNKTTGYISGFVGIDLPYKEGLSCRYEGLITIKSEDESRIFSLPGDSGSLICDEDGRAIGLLIAGSSTSFPVNQRVTYALPIERVLNHLNISLLF
jgi:hypothetical protein